MLSKKNKRKPKRNTSRTKNINVCAINEETAAPRLSFLSFHHIPSYKPSK